MLTWLTDDLLHRALANVVVLAGLTVSAVVAVLLLFRPGSARPVAAAGAVLPLAGRRGGIAQLTAGPGLVAGGFLLSGATSPVWSIVAVLLVGVCAGAALQLLRGRHRDRGDTRVAPAALAVLGTTSALALTGALLVVRLVVVPDPAATAGAAVERSTVSEALSSLVLPFVLVAALLAALLLVRAGRAGWVARGAGVVLDRVTRRRHSSTGRRWESTVPLEVALLLLVVLPLVEGPPALTVARIATPEYAKPLYLVVLAVLLANLAVLFHPRAGWQIRERPTWRPIVPFAVLAIGSGLRSDLGPMVPALAGLLAMYWSMLRAEAQVARVRTGVPNDRAGRRRVRRDVGASARPLVVPALGSLVALGIALAVAPYIWNRFRTWWEPWIYTWVSPCVPAPAGSAPPFAVPDGSVACQEALQTVVAGRLSQISQGLAAIADGGLWGRGLPDTMTGRIPAGPTDLVLAVTWNKLGGLAVLVLSALVVLLGVALVALHHTLRPAARAGDPGRLLVAGAVGTIVGQYLYVLAATLNVVPHSGITAPFLSRGGQSTLAVSIIVMIAVAVGYRRSGAVGRTADPPHRSEQAPGTGLRTTAAAAGALAMAAVLLTASWVVVRPYSGHPEDLPLCRDALAPVDPEVCTTDRFRTARVQVTVSLDGVPAYRRDRAAAGWTPVGEPAATRTDLAGILDDGGGGLVDAAFVEQAAGVPLTSTARRVLPPLLTGASSVDLDLTVDPRLQHATAATLDAEAGGSPLAGGAVVLDARTGHVLAAASVPAAVPPGPADPALAAAHRAARDDVNAGRAMGVRGTDGSIRDLGPDEAGECSTDRMPDDPSRCWRWLAGPSGDDEDLRRYVGGDPDVAVPAAGVDRATSGRYGVGSTFKVVVAAAYLRRPGTGANDRIPAPDEVPRPGTGPVRNAGGGACSGAGADGRIPLTTALAVSCNTAFASLAGELGWEAIRDTAVDLGFGTPSRAAGWRSGPDFGAASLVPDDDASGLANLALGGGEVQAAPLQMASVMATVASGGTAVAPGLVEDARSAGTSGPGTDPAPLRRQVLTPDQAAELRRALGGTVDYGTASRLRLPPALESRPEGQRAWVKTGTHELFPPGTEPPRDVFARQIAWLTGFVETDGGPLAFAVALETRDEAAGAARARAVTERMLEALVEGRR